MSDPILLCAAGVFVGVFMGAALVWFILRDGLSSQDRDLAACAVRARLTEVKEMNSRGVDTGKLASLYSGLLAKLYCMGAGRAFGEYQP